MNIDFIKNGVVIDHIAAGKGIKLYNLLDLDELNASVAVIKNAVSKKYGKKDIIKIAADVQLDFNVIGFVAPTATVSFIKDGQIVEKRGAELPETLVNVIKCENPRCITTCEQELDQVFKLTDKKNGIYRCVYCETKAKI